MKTNRGVVSAKVVTTVSVQGNWLKVLQVERADSVTVLGVKARRLSDLAEGTVSQALREMVDSLPVRVQEVVGLLPASEILTRYVTLPSKQLSELSSMVRYQLEGALPFAVQDCVLSVKVLGEVGEATRVLVAAVHRPVVERLMKLCQSAGLVLTEIATSGEAVGYWHRACWPEGVPALTGGWLAAELSPEGLDLAVFSGGSLVYMRQVTHPVVDFEELVRLIRETQGAYQRENAGPAVQCVTLGGSAGEMLNVPLESLERELGCAVHRVDSAEQSFLKDSVRGLIRELGQEISFSDLLGAACGVQSLSLDLLPLESRVRRLRGLFWKEVRNTAVWGLTCVCVVAAWAGLHIGGVWWQLRETQRKTDMVRPQAARVQSMAESIRSLAMSRESYAFQMESLRRSTELLSAGMTLQFLGLEAGRSLTLRGTAPDLSSVTQYAAFLRENSFWSEVSLNSAKKRLTGGQVDFEFTLKPRISSEKKH